MIFTANLTIISHSANSFVFNNSNHSVKYSKTVTSIYFNVHTLYFIKKMLYICSAKILHGIEEHFIDIANNYLSHNLLIIHILHIITFN